MRLFEAIIDANHRAINGDQTAGVHPSEYQSELPLVALTCIDVRLNPLLPEVLGIPKDQFVWLRNVGNMVDGPMGTMTRSLAMACAIKGAKEIVIIGHTDCQVCKTTGASLLERLRALGIERSALPSNIEQFFGLFSNERANVINAVETARSSPLLGPNTPVQGLLLNTETGWVDWVVNGYRPVTAPLPRLEEMPELGREMTNGLKSLSDFQIGEIKFPTSKIGETVTEAADWFSSKVQSATQPPTGAPAQKPPAPPPIPPHLGQSIRVQKRPK
jgi:carbonic anhydrase